MLVTVHAAPHIAWQGEFVGKVIEGLRRVGARYQVTSSASRIDDGLAVVLGTTCWRAVEASGPYVLVDRCSLGDTRHWVTLVRDGHGRRGDHRVPRGCPPARWEWMEDAAAVRIAPWHNGAKRVLCGQHETYSPKFSAPRDWYRAVRGATHFRCHPAGDNPTGLPPCRSWDGVGQAITLNSSVAVEAVLAGVPTVTMDEAAMAWDVTSHDPTETVKPPRLPWLHWLAWTQWSHDEVLEGKPWARLL